MVWNIVKFLELNQKNNLKRKKHSDISDFFFSTLNESNLQDVFEEIVSEKNTNSSIHILLKKLDEAYANENFDEIEKNLKLFLLELKTIKCSNYCTIQPRAT
jgi:hypothetical protein